MRIETAHNVGIEVEVAGLGDRALAAMIDYVLLFAAMIALSIVATFAASTALLVLAVLPLFLYFFLCEVFFDGQSIGKKLRRIKVARLDGAQPTLGNYLIRWLLRLVEVDLTLGTVALLTVLVNGKGQRLGDLAAGTTVIKLHPRVALDDTLYAHVDAHYHPTFPQVDRLSDAEIETAKETLQALVEEGKSRTAFVLGTKIKATLEAKMNVRSELNPPQFLRTVIMDYNYLHGRG